MSIFMGVHKMDDITLWYRKNKNGQWDYNHFCFGHDKSKTPSPKHINQEKAWKSGEWSSYGAVIKNNFYVMDKPNG
jgi:hypothetical protein